MAGVNPLAAGIACRCPNCGEAPLFEGFLRITARCEACGADLRSADTGDVDFSHPARRPERCGQDAHERSADAAGEKKTEPVQFRQ